MKTDVPSLQDTPQHPTFRPLHASTDTPFAGKTKNGITNWPILLFQPSVGSWFQWHWLQIRLAKCSSVGNGTRNQLLFDAGHLLRWPNPPPYSIGDAL